MKSYRHILLAVDYTAENQPVIARAEQLAKQYRAKLSIVHVLDDIPLPDAGYGTVITLDREMPNELLDNAKNSLLRIAEQLGVKPQNCWLVWGNPKQEIDAFAEKIDAGLIVVGSHGRHGLALLFGSTANSVLHHAQCDVLAVRLQES